MGWVEDKLGHLAQAIADEGERTRLAMAAGLEETRRGLRVDGAASRPVSPNAINVNAAGRLAGWSLRSAGGNVIVLHDGADTSGDVLAVINLADQQSETRWLLPAGVSFVQSLYVEVTGAGTLTGALWRGAVD